MTRVRRSPIELRQSIVEAAEQTFARGAYGSVTLKDIAREAGVAESVLYRHFPSKAELFRESVLLPLMAVLSTFSEASERYLDYPMDNRSLMRLFVGDLFHQLSEHRAALRSLPAAEADLGPEERERLHGALADVLVRIGEVARAEGERRAAGQAGLGVEMSTRVLVGMIIALVVHEEWLLRDLPAGPSRAEVVEHIVEMMLRATGALEESSG